MAAKFGLSLFAVLMATQVLSSSGSPCYCGAPGPSYPQPCLPPSGPFTLPPTRPESCSLLPSPPSYPTPPVYYPPITIAAPPPATFPMLPPLVSPNPLSIPLPLPSVIPVGKICVSKAVQLQPSLVPAARQCKTVQVCPPAQPPAVIPGFCV